MKQQIDNIQKEAEERYRKGEISSVNDFILGAQFILNQKTLPEEKEFELLVYTSKLIPNLIFLQQKDKVLFDKVLEEFCASEEAMKEFENACNQFASLDAVRYHIDRYSFHKELRGPHTLKLLDITTRILECNDYSIYHVMSYILERYKKFKYGR